ncbi:MAG: hypothetical protein HKN49_09450 [Gammaproteobacteria bacterium]|nr:hypothetical protein [Gammaproteobacteria bacterium]
MSVSLAPLPAPAHVAPELLASHVDGRDIPPEARMHIARCDLCRARASDARLLRALLAGSGQAAETHSTIPLDAMTLAGYHDQVLPAEQLAAVDRLLLRDEGALLELIELRLAINASQRAERPDTRLLARTAAAFATARPVQTTRVASLGTLIIDRDSEIPAFHFYDATPESLASDDGPGRTVTGLAPQANDSGSFPAPAARRELNLPAGRHTLRLRMTLGGQIEMFVFDEQHFRPANGVQVTCEPDGGELQRKATPQSGTVSFALPPDHARLLIDAGDRWLLELR